MTIAWYVAECIRDLDTLKYPSESGRCDVRQFGAIEQPYLSSLEQRLHWQFHKIWFEQGNWKHLEEVIRESMNAPGRKSS